MARGVVTAVAAVGGYAALYRLGQTWGAGSPWSGWSRTGWCAVDPAPAGLVATAWAGNGLDLEGMPDHGRRRRSRRPGRP